jgi:hypothetical protein
MNKHLIAKYFISMFLIAALNKSLAQDKFQLAHQKISNSFSSSVSKPKVYLLGVFHFAGEKIDSNTTQFKWRYITSELRRQKEIEVVRQKLLKIKPTVICVEFSPRWQKEMDSVYTSYCNGKLLNIEGYEADGEIVQLAFELGKRLGLKKITAVDAKVMAALNDDKLYEEYEKYAPKNDSLFSYWNDVYYKMATFEDSLRHNWATMDYLRFINSDKHNSKTLGRWLITTRHGKDSNPIGADQFITKYFNRNARIYSNVQRSIKSNDDRVLVIYGNTHMSILKLLFSSSPMYELVPIENFLK